MRPRHVALLSVAALDALAKLFMVIEARGRWPDTLRLITGVALGKKAGGSRLIGLAVALYRIWARLRHEDTKEALEARLSRTFLAAAPGVGAERAAAGAALFCEAAHARGHAAAVSTADISKYYEQVEYVEVAGGGVALGIPREVIMLTIHAYCGPRRIRVGKAWSRAVHPRRSIVAGCTWATVHIRTIAIGPTERFLRTVKQVCDGWEMKVKFSLYVDDLLLATAGDPRAVQWILATVTEMMTMWITSGMRKRLAADKLVCIVGDKPMRKVLARRLEPLGFKVISEGELLGIDCGAGAPLRRRNVQRKRARKAVKRIPCYVGCENWEVQRDELPEVESLPNSPTEQTSLAYRRNSCGRAGASRRLHLISLRRPRR